MPRIEHIKSYTSEKLRELYSTACFHLTLLPVFLHSVCPRTLMRANGNFPFKSPVFLSCNTILFFSLFSPSSVPQNDKRTPPVFKITHTHKNIKTSYQCASSKLSLRHSIIGVSSHKMTLCIHCNISLMWENVSLSYRFLFICY